MNAEDEVRWLPLGSSTPRRRLTHCAAPGIACQLDLYGDDDLYGNDDEDPVR